MLRGLNFVTEAQLLTRILRASKLNHHLDRAVCHAVPNRLPLECVQLTFEEENLLRILVLRIKRVANQVTFALFGS